MFLLRSLFQIQIAFQLPFVQSWGLWTGKCSPQGSRHSYNKHWCKWGERRIRERQCPRTSVRVGTAKRIPAPPLTFLSLPCQSAFEDKSLFNSSSSSPGCHPLWQPGLGVAAAGCTQFLCPCCSHPAAPVCFRPFLRDIQVCGEKDAEMIVNWKPSNVSRHLWRDRVGAVLFFSSADIPFKAHHTISNYKTNAITGN